MKKLQAGLPKGLSEVFQYASWKFCQKSRLTIKGYFAIFATITKVAPETVTVDLNHPYAGKDLTFEGKITEMRDATTEEMQEMINMMSHEGCDCGCDDCEGHHHHDGCGCGHCH